MKKIFFPVVFILFLTLSGITLANDFQPIPITAEEAFDAVQTQIDPNSGKSESIALVDVRTRAEYFWVGAACQVDEIKTAKGETIIPDYGKVLLIENGKFLEFRISTLYRRLQVNKVSEISLSPIAINIPYFLWEEDTGTFKKNTSFVQDVEALSAEYNVLIFFCRSGGRSENCIKDTELNTDLFVNIYEIDQPDGTSGRGGFEGTSYGNVYNGYRGFPGRLTEIQNHPSVSWKDAGLPMKTSLNPLSQ